MSKQFVIYGLAGEQFGVDIAAVESIIKMQTIAAVPQAPDYVEGVTNLRGEVLPVIDLRKRFAIPVTDKRDETRIIVVEIEGQHVGMIVDAVTEVLTLEDDDIEAPSTLVIGSNVDFITGIAKVGDQLVTLIDLKTVLLTEETLDLAAVV
jgi:purine-binding chemotaxis protein CheW